MLRLHVLHFGPEVIRPTPLITTWHHVTICAVPPLSFSASCTFIDLFMHFVNRLWALTLSSAGLRYYAWPRLLDDFYLGLGDKPFPILNDNVPLRSPRILNDPNTLDFDIISSASESTTIQLLYSKNYHTFILSTLSSLF